MPFSVYLLLAEDSEELLPGNCFFILMLPSSATKMYSLLVLGPPL